MHEKVEVGNGTVGIGIDVGHRKTRHTLEYTRQNSVSGQFTSWGLFPQQVGHIDEGAATGSAANGEDHVNFDIGAQQFVFFVVADSDAADVVEGFGNFSGQVGVIYREGESAVGPKLACTAHHLT